MKVFFATLGFLTRLPAPSQEMLSPEEFKKGIVYYPIVGVITGILMALVYGICFVWAAPLPAAIMAVMAQACITGGFHLDGLSDSFDGLFSARDRDRMLEIMRDSRVGTFGVLSIFFVLLLKISVLFSLSYEEALIAILLYPAAGKAVTPILMHSRYARETQGLGSIYLSEAYTGRMVFAMVLGFLMILIGYFILGNPMAGLIATLCACTIAAFFRRYCQKVLGGMTGDTLGCGAELCEVIFLLAILIARRLL